MVCICICVCGINAAFDMASYVRDSHLLFITVFVCVVCVCRMHANFKSRQHVSEHTPTIVVLKGHHCIITITYTYIITKS